MLKESKAALFAVDCSVAILVEPTARGGWTMRREVCLATLDRAHCQESIWHSASAVIGGGRSCKLLMR
jgi:hypothetical protein